jgi:hypothetical protein
VYRGREVEPRVIPQAPARRVLPPTPDGTSRIEIAPGVEEEIHTDGRHRRRVIIIHHLGDGEY